MILKHGGKRYKRGVRRVTLGFAELGAGAGWEGGDQKEEGQGCPVRKSEGKQHNVLRGQVVLRGVGVPARAHLEEHLRAQKMSRTVSCW